MPSPFPRAGCSRAGHGTAFAGSQGAIQPQASQNTLGSRDSPGTGLSLWSLTSAQLSGASSFSLRAAPANGTAALCPAATPVPSHCPGSVPRAQGLMCGWLPRTCMRLKRELMAASSSLALLRTSSIMALSRTMASRVDVCSSFTACPGWRGGCSARDSTAPPRHPHTPQPCPPSLPGPAAGSPACTPSQCRCSVPGSPCRHRHQGKAQDGAHSKHGAGATHPCMSLKQLMQSMDFFSVENMM